MVVTSITLVMIPEVCASHKGLGCIRCFMCDADTQLGLSGLLVTSVDHGLESVELIRICPTTSVGFFSRALERREKGNEHEKRLKTRSHAGCCPLFWIEPFTEAAAYAEVSKQEAY